MKKTNRARFLVIALTVLTIFCLTPGFLAAQPGIPCDPLDPLCPVDGGVLLLLSAGIGLGAKKFKKK